MVTESPSLTPKLRSTRIDIHVAEQIAELVVKYRMTESEACLHLGIKPQSWFDKKCRRMESKYADIISRIRAGQLQNVIDSISRAGDEQTKVTRAGNAIQVPGDWRAKAWIAERVLAPERLGDRQQSAGPAQPVQINVMLSGVERAYAQVVCNQPQPKQIEKSHDVPQLTDVKSET